LKKVYFAAPFVFDDTGSLRYDLRALILGSEEKLLAKKREADNPVIGFEGEKLEYTGPFYYEEISNGVFSDSDCFGVVKKELSLIDECDILIVIFDGTPAPGTVSELIYAAMRGKEIRLFYKKESADYDIDSLYWYPIVTAQTLSDSVTAVPFTDLREVLINFG